MVQPCVRLLTVLCVCVAVFQPEKVTEMVNLKFKFNWIFAALDIASTRIASKKNEVRL